MWAHDASRPFTVTAGPQTVVAVGTSFDVERLQSRVLITLIQGQVVIKSGASRGRRRKQTGQPEKPDFAQRRAEQLVVARNVRPAIVAADLQVARGLGGWSGCCFRDEPLGDAVARVNRYTDATHRD